MVIRGDERQLRGIPCSSAVRASIRLDFRGDPADEIIAATSLVHGVHLLTRDTRIRASKIVPLP